MCLLSSNQKVLSMKNRMTKLEKQNRMKVLMLLKFLAQIKNKIGLLSLAREFED